MGISFCCEKNTEKDEAKLSIRSFPISSMVDFENSKMETEKSKEFKIKSSSFVRRRSCSFNDVYETLEVIGEGNYGKIMKVRHLFSNELRVIKEISKIHLLKGVSENDIITEINILKSMDHPNIIKVYEFFSDENNIYIVKEYLKEGDLFNNLTKLNMSETLICNILRQILSAVSYLHSKKVLHGDLKLENILIENDSLNLESVNIKITDFGCSKIFHNKVCRKIIGTSYTLAPEILENEYNEKCDLWSAGVILYILLSETLPFKGTEKEIIEKIRIKTKVDFDLDEFKNFSSDALDVLKSLLNYNYHERPSAIEILKHPWFKMKINNEINLIDKSEIIKTLGNLRNFHFKSKFHQAVITFLTHNVEKNEEVNKLRQIYKILDNDFDGKISISDLKKGLEDNFKNIDFLEAQNIIKNISSNDECFIEYEDFLNATLDKNFLFKEKKLKQAFDLFDIHKHGIIHANEIKKVLFQEQEVSDESLAIILDEIQVKIDDDIKYDTFKNLMYEAIINDKTREKTNFDSKYNSFENV